MKITRRQLRKLIKESTVPDHDALEMYTDWIIDHVFQVLNNNNVMKHVNSLKVSDHQGSYLAPFRLTKLKDITDNHKMLNDIVLEVGVTDDMHIDTTGGYAVDTNERHMSDLIITVILPRDVPIENYEEQLQAELEELVRHELEHSIDSTENLTAASDARNKWDNLENLFQNYASDAETRAHVKGFKRKVKFLKSKGYDVSLEHIMQLYIQNVIYEPALNIHRYTDEEISPVLNRIYTAWIEAN